MAKQLNNIWQSLTHDNVLNSLEITLQIKLSNLFIKRNSYINRVYELEKAGDKERFIVKFYRPGRWSPEMIKEEHIFVRDLFAQENPVIPPLPINGQTIFFLENIPYAVYPKKGGRALDEFDQDTWQGLGRLLARVHQTGAKHAKANRLSWSPAQATKQHMETLLQEGHIPAEYQKVFVNVIETFIKKYDPWFKPKDFILLHGDCHKGNLIHRPGEGVFLVDFDDICLGPPVQDLWMLLPGLPEESEREIDWFLKGYNLFREFKQDTLQLIPALRGMRIIHFAAWCAVQSKDPDFNEHFPEWGTLKYWNSIIKDMQEIVFQNEI